MSFLLAVAMLAGAPAFATHPQPLAPAAQRGAFAGAIAPNEPLSIFVCLRGQHAADADRAIAAQNAPGSPAYRHYLTPEQYGRYFGATERDYADAIATLRRAGFIIDDLLPNRTLIEVHAPARLVEAFFETPIDLRVENGRTFFTNRYLPHFAPGLHAVAVVGLDDYVQRHAHSGHGPAVPQSVVSGLHGWAPPDIQSAYNLTPVYASATGAGETVIDATFERVRQSDFAAFTKQFGLQATLQQQSQKGSPLDSGGESTLDVEWMAAIAPQVNVLLVTPRANTDAGFTWMYSHIVNKLSSDKVVSTSWGSCEQDEYTSTITTDNALFQQAQLEGQWWLAAAGDWGSDDCELKKNGPVAVDYPGSTPYVVSVGGTRVVPAAVTAGNYTGWSNEIVWHSHGCGSSGGGVSTLFAQPSFQAPLVTAAMREVPDVALMADGCYRGGYIIYLKGGWQNTWYGTSFAAPEWGAFLTLIEQRYGTTPIVSPLVRLYALAATLAYPTLFHNILRGCNTWFGVPGYCAHAGYSETSGLGSFQGAALQAAY